MLSLLSRTWWAIALRGISALVLAALVLLWPGRTLLTLIFLFGVYTLVDGVVLIWSVLRAGKQHQHRWAMLFEGVVDIVAGVLTFIIPSVSARFLLIILALWAITTGVSEIRSAIRLRREIVGEWLLALGGLVSLLFGLLLLVLSAAGSVIIVLLIGGYALIFGILLLLLAFRLRWAGAGASTTESRS